MLLMSSSLRWLNDNPHWPGLRLHLLVECSFTLQALGGWFVCQNLDSGTTQQLLSIIKEHHFLDTLKSPERIPRQYWLWCHGVTHAHTSYDLLDSLYFNIKGSETKVNVPQSSLVMCSHKPGR